MIYNEFKDKKLSALGMGCMRFPTLENGDIDVCMTRDMIDYAMKNGINYYDTAWMYHNGSSEPVLGEILASYPRESFYLATKFPGMSIENVERVEEIFNEQIKRLRVDCFDFYLFHNVTENNIDWYTDPKYGIFDYLMRQKKEGRIRHLGFSAHGNMETLKRFLEAYGKDMEFCQLQINWHDWHFQDAKAKVELMSSYGIPVWVMEPVRGGSLASIDSFYMSKLKALRPDFTPAEWAFRFVQTISEVKMTLSGMSNFDQLKENIKTYSAPNPLTDTEIKTLFEISSAMASEKILPCTSCRYCTTKCPMELDIPTVIGHYNEYIYSGKAAYDGKSPSECIACRACEEICPQNIKISEMMSGFAEKIK